MDRSLESKLNQLGNAGIWLAATVIAAFFALLIADSAIVGDMVIPRSNDSFYHARRILDFAIGDTGFYQYEERINPPEGIWIPWPWGYDYFMAMLLKLMLLVRPEADPMTLLAYVPVAWIGVNAALFLIAANLLGLSGGMRFLVMLAFALSPLTQLLHGMAMVDHHYIEHTFVLLSFAVGMYWLEAPAARGRAILLGAMLGVAPAFHNGLFMLQLIPLGAFIVLWLRGTLPERREMTAFAIALIVASLCAVLPSAPFRAGMFAFGYLSWFHLYVAICTAVVSVCLSLRPFSTRQAALIAGVSLALGVPLLTQILLGATFLAGGVSVLDNIIEAQNPLRMYLETLGPTDTIGYYSWLVVLIPVTLIYAIWTLLRDNRPRMIYFAVASVLGLVLMSFQFRFYYFGLFALFAGVFLLCDRIRERFGWHRGIVFVVSFGLLVLAFQTSLRQKLFTIYAIAGDPAYQSAITIFLELTEICEKDPGVILANNDDGSAILYHSDCSVIANNFFLDAEDEIRINTVTMLMRSDPEWLLSTETPIRYLLMRRDNFMVGSGDDRHLDTSNRLVSDIWLKGDEPPEGFELVSTVYLRWTEDDEPIPHARLYRLHRPDEAD